MATTGTLQLALHRPFDPLRAALEKDPPAYAVFDEAQTEGFPQDLTVFATLPLTTMLVRLGDPMQPTGGSGDDENKRRLMEKLALQKLVGLRGLAYTPISSTLYLQHIRSKGMPGRTLGRSTTSSSNSEGLPAVPCEHFARLLDDYKDGKIWPALATAHEKEGRVRSNTAITPAVLLPQTRRVDQEIFLATIPSRYPSLLPEGWQTSPPAGWCHYEPSDEWKSNRCLAPCAPSLQALLPRAWRASHLAAPTNALQASSCYLSGIRVAVVQGIATELRRNTMPDGLVQVAIACSLLFGQDLSSRDGQHLLLASPYKQIKQWVARLVGATGHEQSVDIREDTFDKAVAQVMHRPLSETNSLAEACQLAGTALSSHGHAFSQIYHSLCASTCFGCTGLYTIYFDPLGTRFMTEGEEAHRRCTAVFTRGKRGTLMIAPVYTQGLSAVLQTFSLRKHGNLETISKGQDAEHVAQELSSTGTQAQMTTADFFAFIRPECKYQWVEVPWALVAQTPHGPSSGSTGGSKLDRAVGRSPGGYRMYLRPLIVDSGLKEVIEHTMGPQWVVQQGCCGNDEYLVWGFGTRDPLFQAVLAPVLFDGQLYYSLHKGRRHFAWCPGAALGAANSHPIELSQQSGRVKLCLEPIANFHFLEDLQQTAHGALGALIPESDSPALRPTEEPDLEYHDDEEPLDAAVEEDQVETSRITDEALGELAQELCKAQLDVNKARSLIEQLPRLSSSYPYAILTLDLQGLGRVLGRFFIVSRQLNPPPQLREAMGPPARHLDALVKSLAKAIATGLYDALNHPSLSPLLLNELHDAIHLQEAAVVERLLWLAFIAAKDMEQRRRGHPQMNEPTLPTAQLIAAWSSPVKGEGAQLAARYVHLYIPACVAYALIAARGVTIEDAKEEFPEGTTGFFKHWLLHRGTSGTYACRVQRATFRQPCLTMRATNELLLTELPQECPELTNYLFRLLDEGRLNRGALPLLSTYRFFAVKVELITLLPNEGGLPTPEGLASLVMAEHPKGTGPLSLSVSAADYPRLVGKTEVTELHRWLLRYKYLAVPWNQYVLKGTEALRAWLNSGRPHTMNRGLEQQAYESSKDTEGRSLPYKHEVKKARKQEGE